MPGRAEREFEELRTAAVYAVQVWLLTSHQQTAATAQQYMEEAMTRLRSALAALERAQDDPGPPRS